MSEKHHRRKKPKAKGKPQKGRYSSPVAVVTRKLPMTDIAIWWIVGFATLMGILVGVLYADHKVLAVWLFFSCVVLYALAGCLFWQQKIAPSPSDVRLDAIRMQVAGSFLSPAENPGLWVRYHAAKGDALQPVNLALGTTITNIGQVAESLDRISVKVRKDGGGWLRLSNIPPMGNSVYLVADGLNKALLVEFDGMDSALYGHPLAPNIPARGWMFFRWPDGFVFEPNHKYEYRFESVDTAGNRFDGSLQINDPSAIGELRTNSPNLRSKGIREDLTSLPIIVPR